MAGIQWPFLAVVLLLVARGLQCPPPLPACPVPCFCHQAPLLNCSSSGLSLAPKRIQAAVTKLDLSHNLLTSVTLRRPHPNLRNVWLGNNSITHLSFCVERITGTQYVRGGHEPHGRPWSRWGCVSWAPALQLLSVERNQLSQLPEGLGGSQALQVLQLSYNKISTLPPEDLRNLGQLKELHLQHNLITSLHSQMLLDLTQLRVLDLSFNLLTTLHPSSYRSLRNIGAEVRLSGNKWRCDCSMHSLRRWMDYDSKRGQQAWSIVCASPSTLSGRDLLQLEEDELICSNAENRPGIHQDVTVDRGTEILLPCSTQQDSTWWTPTGQMSASQSEAGLLISGITERDAGLYVCVSKSHQEIVSVFNLQIRKRGETKSNARIPRSLPRSSQPIIPQGIPPRMGQGRNRSTTQPDLVLAVCLSVFITFLVAFILGVLARPLIDLLWRRLCRKKRSSPTHSVSSAEQTPYDNEVYDNDAYSSIDESEEIRTPRERRVTFSTVDYKGDNNVDYYDTLIIGNQENINEGVAMEYEAAEDNHQSEKDKHGAGAGDSGSDSSSQRGDPENNQRGSRDGSGVTDPGPKHSTEFEPIPDLGELEEIRSLSSHSDTSLSDKEQKEEQMTQRDPWTPQLVEDPLQQRSKSPTVRPVEGPQSEILGFSSEPFADWSPHVNGAEIMEPDLSNESGENFEFTDSIHSGSPRSSSLFGSFNVSNPVAFPPSDDWKRSDRSSSSSDVSGNEPTQYTVNPETDEEEDVEMINNGQLTRDTKREIASTCFKHDAGSEQQIHGEDPIKPSLQGEEFNQGDYRHETQRPSMGPEHSDPSHSSDSDEEPVQYRVNRETYENEEREGEVSKSDKSVSSMTTVERDRAEEVSPMPGADLDPEAKWSGLSLSVPLVSKHLDTRAPSPSPPPAYSYSSSSDSEAEMTQNKDRMEVRSHEPETQWPQLDLKSIPQIKRRLDIKAPSPPPDSSSSSSESEDETTDTTVKLEGVRTDMGINHEPETKWPDLGVPYFKRRLDIKAPSPPPDSYISSESADETTDHIVKQQQGKVDIEGLTFKESPIVRHEPETRWPDLSLVLPQIKRRLDIKAPPPPPGPVLSSVHPAPLAAESNSSSSDSEAEMTQNKDRMEVRSHEPETQWPQLDLKSIPQIKRRLDVKAPSPPPDSYISSESADETTDHIVKQQQGKVDIEGLPFKESPIISHEPETRWPDLSLVVPQIKRRLDIKAPSPPLDSFSSSSEIEDETTDTTVKLEGVRTDVGITSHEPETKWPDLSLGIPQIKRRLDIKAPSPPPDSYISSESADETIDHIVKQQQVKVDIEGLTFKESPIVRHEPETRWPDLNLGVPQIKRRLDIKAPSPPPPPGPVLSSVHPAPLPAESNSSSSDSETEMTQNKDRMEVGSHEPETQWPHLDLTSIPQIKRRLDIKAPSPPPDSYISSESADETIDHIVKQQQGKVDIEGLTFKESPIVSHEPETRWPDLNLVLPQIKRRLDVKAPSPPLDSFSSSSESEDETTDTTVKLEGVRTDVGITSHEPETKWRDLSLGIPQIKRRLDIKAPSPPPGPVLSSVHPAPLPAESNSSSSDGEAEMTQNKDRMEVRSHEPGTQWPQLDLKSIPQIKRRLDIKAPSPPPGPVLSTVHPSPLAAESNSSSSDSEAEMAQNKDRMEVRSHEPETQWPQLDLKSIPQIKRRLDIKAPSPPLDSSSSSSEIEDETTDTTVKLEGVRTDVGITSHEPETKWPDLSLGIPQIKRRLDIKAPSPPPPPPPGPVLSTVHPAPLPAESNSSSSDGETEMTQNKDRMEVRSHEPETQWPHLDLTSIPQIKRRLDIKAPSPPPDSYISSESADETIDHIVKQQQGKVDIEGLTFKESPIVRHEPETRWPDLNLVIPQIKRRLDIKAPSPPPDSSSSSSESEDETTDTTVKLEGVRTDMGINHEPETKWPDLGVSYFKRRLDIKAPSPPPDSSSSSSEIEDETTDTTVKLEGVRTVVGITSHEPETKWPDLSLGIPQIKRRLDIKAPSPSPSPGPVLSSVHPSPLPAESNSSSSDSETEMTQNKDRMEVGSHEPETQWPHLDLTSIPQIKRRLDIKAPSPPPDSSSSSSESEDETTDTTVKLEGVRTDMGINHEPETKWPDLSLGIPQIKRRLDIKAPPPPGPVLSTVHPAPLAAESNSSSSDGENENRDLDLKSIPQIKRRLDIKAPSPPPDPSSSSSESENENRDHTAKLGVPDVSRAAENESIRSPKETLMTIFHTPKRTDDIKLEKYAIIGELESKATAENISPALNVTPELESQWSGLNLGISRFRRRLDITSHKDVPPKMPSLPPPDSSSSGGESGDESKSVRQKERLRRDNDFPTTEGKSDPEAMWGALSVPHIKKHLDVPEEALPTLPYTTHYITLSPPPDPSSSSDDEDKSGKRWRGKSPLPVVVDEESPESPLSLYRARVVNISFDQSENSFEEEEAERKTRLHLKSQTSKVEGELESKWPHLSLRNLKAPSPSESPSSSSNKSEDETVDRTVHLERDSVDVKVTSHERETTWPDLSAGVPRIKRYLNIKAPAPQPTDPSSSNSERRNELTGHAANQNRDGIDMSGITIHKHVAIKAPSHPSDLSPSGSEDETTEHATQEALTVAQEDPPHSVGRMKSSLAPRSFDDVVRRRMEQARRTPAVDPPPELRWTAIGHMSDLPTSSPRRNLDAGDQPAQEAPPAVPGSPPPDTSSSSSESGDEMKQDGEKASNKYLSLGPVTVPHAPSRALNISSSSTDELAWRATGESRGLSALKSLVSQRQKWDAGQDEMDSGSSPLGNDQAATSFNPHSSEKDVDKPLAILSLPELLLSSTSVANTRVARSPHVGDVQPPPYPAEPPPEEEVEKVAAAAGPTQGSEWKSMGPYQQRSSPSSVSQGDEGERSAAVIGVRGATPYHRARRYQRVSLPESHPHADSEV